MKSIIAFALAFLVFGCHAEVSEETKRIVEEWTPLFWLHSEEVFFPTNYDYYIENMELRDKDENVVQANPTSETMMTGPETKDMHLNTFEDIECVRCVRDHFYGQPLDQVKKYVVVKEWNDECNTIDVNFKTWYAYNYGKDVCLSYDPNGFCLGIRKTMGNHIGDGDHSTMRIQNGTATRLRLNVHNIGATYEYDEAKNTFNFVEGDNEDIGGFIYEVEYPDTVETLDDTHHPVIFVSNGSHGNWGSPGMHRYTKVLFIHLDDYTDRGHEWRYWEDLNFLDQDDLDEGIVSPDLHWTGFQGRFGNQQKLGCEFESLVGICGLGKTSGSPINSASNKKSFFDDPPVCPEN